jgi:hypothetical protein
MKTLSVLPLLRDYLKSRLEARSSAGKTKETGKE